MKYSKYVFSSVLALALASNALIAKPALAAGGSTAGSGTECGAASEPKVDEKKKQKDPKKQQAHALEMGGKLVKLANDNNATVLLVSRAGSDMSNRTFYQGGKEVKQKFSHIGIMHKISLKDGRTAWRFTHLLNTCAGPTSDIYTQKVPQFFLDDPYKYDVIVTIPSQKLQDGISAVLEEGRVVEMDQNKEEEVGLVKAGTAKALHHDRYNNIANPFSMMYQNSNMWVLSVIAAAQSGLKTRAEVQKYYESTTRFEPTQVKLGFFTRTIGVGFASNSANDDKTPEEMSSGKLNFVSASGTHKYVEQTDRAILPLTQVCPNEGCDKLVEDLDLLVQR